MPNILRYGLFLAWMLVCAAMLARHLAPAPPDAATGITVRITIGTMLDGWVNAALQRYHPPAVDGRPVTFTAVVANSGEVIEAIRQGQRPCDLWITSRRMWFDRANDLWHAGGRTADLFPTNRSLARLPLVVAMRREQAQVAGWRDTVTCEDLTALARAGWASRGSPAWGEFRWTHAIPGSGLGELSLIALLLHQGALPGVEDFTAPGTVQRLREVEATIPWFGVNSRAMADRMEAGDALDWSRQPYLSAALEFENLVVAHNRRPGASPWVALYPRGGTFVFSCPAAVAAGGDPRVQRAAEGFLAWLAGPEGQTLAFDMGIRPADSRIPMPDSFRRDGGISENFAGVPILEEPSLALSDAATALWQRLVQVAEDGTATVHPVTR